MMFELLFSELFFTALFAMSAYHSIILFFAKVYILSCLSVVLSSLYILFIFLV